MAAELGGGWTHRWAVTTGAPGEGGSSEVGCRSGDAKSTNKVFIRLQPIGDWR